MAETDQTECEMCEGTGDCLECEGSTVLDDCIVCGGTGDCPNCGGYGAY